MKASFLVSCAAAAILSGGAGAAFAADADVAATAADSGTGVQEVVVTAQRRNESIQKVPMTVQAITGDNIAKLNLTTLTDVLRYTPNVTYGSNGPGQGSVFMRGLSAGQAGNQSSATVGNFPNVAIYLDDQSMQFPGRNVDVYLADMQRVEVLEGPQGTLFGGGAEAGAIRYITNKPQLDAEHGSVEGSYGFTSHGADNSAITAVINMPLVKDKFAVRAVIWNDRQGGYIDNVPSTFTRSDLDNNSYFGVKPNAAGICPDGGKAGSAGFCTLPGLAQANNFDIAKKDFNPVTNQGARVSALWQATPDWDVLISQSLQSLDVEGLATQYPVGSDFQPLQPLQVTAFSPTYDRDKFSNTAWTVNGKAGDIRLIYTGAWTDRRLKQQNDYTNYSRTLYGQYYECTGGTFGLLGSGPIRCYSPITNWTDKVRNTHLSNEFRASTPDTWRLRAIGGLYHEEFRVYDVMDFNYKTVPACHQQNNLAVALAGGAPCFGNAAPVPGTTMNEPGLRPDMSGFGEDVQRGYTQFAAFGSLDFDLIPNVLTLTAGTRYYSYNEDEKGSLWHTNGGCLNVLVCAPYTAGNIDAEKEKVTYSGFKSRFGVQYHPNETTMVYFLYSQGFRPGGFSRNSKDVALDANKVPQFKTPLAYAPDTLTNYEIGAKTQFFDHRLQLNVSAYWMQWVNAQIALFQPCCLGNTTFLLNGPNYDIKGFEAQFVGRVTEGFTLQGAITYNDNSQSNSPCLTDNEPASPGKGQCITSIKGKPFANPFGVSGGVSAFSPKWQANIRGRYEWMVNDFKAFASLGASYTDKMFTQPANYTPGTTPSQIPVPDTTYLRYELPAYATADGSIGFGRNNWSFQVYAENLFDSRAITYAGSTQFIHMEVPLRPRVVGMKITASF
jgi:outer membrane receptor protein involved in Fe transport